MHNCILYATSPITNIVLHLAHLSDFAIQNVDKAIN